MGKPLGRPPKNQDPEHQIKMAKSVSQRNEIVATFGTGKRVYLANNIRAKLPQTANCWTGMCYFVKNVMKFLKELLWLLTFLIDLLENQSIVSRLSKGRVGKLNNAIVGWNVIQWILYTSNSKVNSKIINTKNLYFIIDFIVIRINKNSQNNWNIKKRLFILTYAPYVA